MTKKVWMISFLSLLGINIAIAGFLSYDIGFNDSEITNNTLEKIQDKVLSYKGELLDEVDKVNENPTAYSIDEILERTGLSDVKDEDAVKKQNLTTNTSSIYTKNLTVDEKSRFLEFFNKNKKEFRVTSVPDGDTIGGYWVSDADKVTYGENRQSIRMTSIDTPESTSLTKPNVWQKNWGKKAGAFAKNLLHNTDNKVRVYVLTTSDSSHGRVVGSVWYEKDGEIYSYAHNVLSAGLAIPARLKTQTHYSLDSGDATNDKDKGDIEAKFEITLNAAFLKGIKDEVGMWNSDDLTNASLEGYQTYDKTTNWYDIFNGDMDYLDIDIPKLSQTMDEETNPNITFDYETNLNQFATIIELYVYPAITWWQSDDKSKRKTNVYCTLDTLIHKENPCQLYT